MHDWPNMRRCAVVLVGLVVLCAGCSTTQVRELWERFGFGRPAVVELKPSAIRAAVKLPRPARPSAEGAALRLEVGGDGETQRFAMVMVNEGRAVRAESLPEAEPGYSWYVFKLTPAAEERLDGLQAELADSGGEDARTGVIEVRNQYSNAIPGQQLTRGVWIQLSREDGFFPLVENETITIGEDGEVLR